MKKTTFSCLLAAAALLTPCALSAGGENSGGNGVRNAPPPETSGENAFVPDAMSEQNRVNIEKLSNSVALAAFHLKINRRGQYPRFMNREQADALISDGIPHRQAAFALKKDVFVLQDVFINPEFISKVTVESGGRTYPAAITGYSPSRRAVFLRTASPVEGVVPLNFRPFDEKEEYFTFQLRSDGGNWTWWTRPFTPPYAYELSGRSPDGGKGAGLRYRSNLPAEGLIVDRFGNASALFFSARLAGAEELDAPPEKWPVVSAAAMAAAGGELARKISGRAVFTVKLNFHQPRKDAKRQDPGGERPVVHMESVGILLDDGLLLIPEELSRSDTARLESVLVMCGGKAVPAAFVGSLRDFGGFTVRPAAPLPWPGLKLEEHDFADMVDHPVHLVYLGRSGDRIDADIERNAVRGVMFGRKNARIVAYYAGGVCLGFDDAGKLLTVPLRVRDYRRVRAGGAGAPVYHVAVNELVRAFASGGAYDPGNVPRKDWSRAAYLGIRYQALSRKMAEARSIMRDTNSGAVGLEISYVYPGGPADRAGLKAGDVILRIVPEDGSAKLEMEVSRYRTAPRAFHWKMLDRLPESYFDKIPAPWESEQNRFNADLSNLGVGKSVRVVFLDNGNKVKETSLRIEESPEIYENAESYEDPLTGLTLRPMTFEVRRYFRSAPEERSLVVAGVKPGSPASIAGIRPYERLAAVNGVRTGSPEEYRKVVAESKGGELRLELRRLSDSRVVRLEVKK